MMNDDDIILFFTLYIMMIIILLLRRPTSDRSWLPPLLKSLVDFCFRTEVAVATMSGSGSDGE